MIDWGQIVIWGVVIAVALVVAAFLWKILRLAILFIAALAAFTLIADKLYGGTAMDQIAIRIADWLRVKLGL